MSLPVSVRRVPHFLIRVPPVFVGPRVCQHSRSWHSSPASRAKSSGTPTGAVSLTARKSAEKAFDLLWNSFTDPATSQALVNLGCRDPGNLLECIISSSHFRMRKKWSPNDIKDIFIFVCIQHAEFNMTHFQAEGKHKFAERFNTSKGDFEALSREPALASEAIYLSAHRLWNCADLKSVASGVDILPLAKWMLTLALEMGNLKAALDLAHVANLNPDGVIPPAALREIRAAAVEHNDSRAMAVYARYLLNLRNAADKSTRKDAFDLALELSLASEPADPSTAIRLTNTAFHKWEAPWMLVRDAARQRLEIDYPSPADPQHKEINRAFVAALREGVNSYSDPEAARDLSDHPEVEEFSSEWTDLKTISAMEGDPKSCYDLGRYYIEYWGWYPCIGKMPSDNPDARIGLDWLELSAEGCHDDANEMQRRYLIVALLFRENGMRDEGHQVVKRGITTIEEYSKATNWRTWAVRQLQVFDREWDFAFSARAKDFLGVDAEPKLSPEQRHKDLPGGGGGGLLSWFR